MFRPKADVTDDMAQLVKSLRQPGKLEELKATANSVTLDLDLDDLPSGNNLADMVDALGDKMSQQ